MFAFNRESESSKSLIVLSLYDIGEIKSRAFYYSPYSHHAS